MASSPPRDSSRASTPDIFTMDLVLEATPPQTPVPSRPGGMNAAEEAMKKTVQLFASFRTPPGSTGTVSSQPSGEEAQEAFPEGIRLTLPWGGKEIKSIPAQRGFNPTTPPVSPHAKQK